MIFRYLFFLLITFGTCSAQTKEINISRFKINEADDIDDTQQLDEAIAYIAEKGGTLSIPAGRYILDNNNRKRIGVNSASYIFLAKNSFTIKMHPNAILLYKNGFKGFRFRTTTDPNKKTVNKLSAKIEGGTIDAKDNFPKKINGNPEIWAFALETFTEAIVTNVKVQNMFGTAGIASYQNSFFKLKNSLFTNVAGNPFDYVDNHGNGVYVHSTAKYDISNNLFVNKSSRIGTVGICIEDNLTGSGVITNNLITGYDRAIHVELISGTATIDSNKLIGNLSGVVLWNNFGNKQIVTNNFISNQGLAKDIKPILYTNSAILLLGKDTNNGSLIQNNKIELSEKYFLPNSLLQVTSSNMKIVNNAFKDFSKSLALSISEGRGANDRVKNIEFSKNTVIAKKVFAYDGSLLNINNNSIDAEELTFSFDDSENRFINNQIRLKGSSKAKILGNYKKK